MGRFLVAANYLAFKYLNNLLIDSVGGIPNDYYYHYYLDLMSRHIIPSFYFGMSMFMFSDLASKKIGLLPIIKKVYAGKLKKY